ncbi:MAG: DUF3256 family protein [Bacteroidaceae bacterium]|nr:DUF3256 family protein [Bacteroidaceae bacterium]
MTSRHLFIILTTLFCLSGPKSASAAQPFQADSIPAPKTLLMRDLFAALPDSILPTTTRYNRLDCIDFIENGMEAKVRGAFNEFVTLEALTPTYLRFTTSSSAYIEMKLLPVADSLIICLVSTIVTGSDSLMLKDSSIRFYTTSWRALPQSDFLTIPAVPDFCTGALSSRSLVPMAEAAQRSLMDFHPIHASLSPDSLTLTLTLQTSDLSIDQRQAARKMVLPLTMVWKDCRWQRGTAD